MNVPTKIYAGDTVTWSEEISDYSPAGGYAFTVEFRGQTSLTITGVANASGSGWDLTVTAAQSRALLAGVYAVQMVVTKAAERYTVGVGSCTVLQNLATTAGGYEARSSARIVYDQCQAALRTWSADPYAEREIAGRRKVWRMDEILKLRNIAAREIYEEERAERIAKGLDAGGKILVRFPCIS